MGRISRSLTPFRRAWREIRRRARHLHARLYGPVWPVIAITITFVIVATVHVVSRAVVPGWEWFTSAIALVALVALLRRPRGTPPKDWGK